MRDVEGMPGTICPAIARILIRTVVRRSPVAPRSSVTLLLGMTAPVESVTVPSTSVDVVWANINAVLSTKQSTNNAL